MDNKIKPADHPTDSHVPAQDITEQDKGSKAPVLEGWVLTSEQRKFIESLQNNDSDSD